MSVLMSGLRRVIRSHMVLSHTTIPTTMKTKKAAKYIVKHEDLFTPEEKSYAQLVLKAKKLHKKLKKNEQRKTDLGDT